MSEYGIQDFTRCPESSCDNVTPVGLDYYHNGEMMFLSFNCPHCMASSLEDDFEWYVRCPSCHEDDERLGGVECVDGGVKESGLIWFECTDCGASVEEYVDTKWDSNADSIAHNDK